MKQLAVILSTVLLAFTGCVTDPVTGQKSFDPEIRNAIIEVARGAVSGLAAGAATTGQLNWQSAAQGALAQVYSTQSIGAINKAVSYSGLSTGYQAAVTTAVHTVVAAAQAKGLDQQTAILTGTTFLDQALQTAKAP